MSAIPQIDLAWEAVNALGGLPSDDPREQGFVEAISKALDEIERLGGKDPSQQRPAEKRRKDEIMAAFDAAITAIKKS